MTYFRCVFQRVSISPAKKLLDSLASKKSAARKFAVEVVCHYIQLPVFLFIMCYNGSIGQAVKLESYGRL